MVPVLNRNMIQTPNMLPTLPPSNGFLERYVGTIKNTLKPYLLISQTNRPLWNSAKMFIVSRLPSPIEIWCNMPAGPRSHVWGCHLKTITKESLWHLEKGQTSPRATHWPESPLTTNGQRLPAKVIQACNKPHNYFMISPSRMTYRNRQQLKALNYMETCFTTNQGPSKGPACTRPSALCPITPQTLQATTRCNKSI